MSFQPIMKCLDPKADLEVRGSFDSLSRQQLVLEADTSKCTTTQCREWLD